MSIWIILAPMLEMPSDMNYSMNELNIEVFDHSEWT